MEIKALELFVAVARRGGFAAVAREHGVDASSVSRTIAGLEREIGARLFQRTTRRLALTEAGALYLGRVAPLVEELGHAHEAVAEAQGDPTGVLRLTTTVAFGQVMIAPLLADFRSAFPRLQLELLFTDANLDLVDERIDVAIRLGPSYRADVIGSKLFATRYRLVCGPDWPGRAVMDTPEALARARCLLFALPEFRTRWLFRRAGKISEVIVAGDLITSNMITLKSAALAGLGPALLADWLIAEDLAAGRLVDLFPKHEATATSFDTAAWLLYPSRDHLPLKVRATLDFLRERLGRGA